MLAGTAGIYAAITAGALLLGEPTRAGITILAAALLLASPFGGPSVAELSVPCWDPYGRVHSDRNADGAPACRPSIPATTMHPIEDDSA